MNDLKVMYTYTIVRRAHALLDVDIHPRLNDF